MHTPSIRRLAQELSGVQVRLRHLETVPQLVHSSIDDSALPVYDAEGTVVARVGKQADGTWGAPPLAGPTPPTPAGVAATGGAGVVNLTWTGEFEGGAAAPLDFDTLEVLVNGQLAGSLSNRAGGSVSVPAAEGNRFVSARVRTLVPRHSSTTSPFAVTVGPPPDQLAADLAEKLAGAEDAIAEAAADLDVALLRPEGSAEAQEEFVARVANILKLNVENLVVTEGATINQLVALAIAGATAEFQEAYVQNLKTTGAQVDTAVIRDLAADIITSGLFRTAASGQRVVIDEDGLVMYGVGADGEDVELVRIGPSGANLITVGDTTVSPDSVQSPAGSFNSLSVGGDTLPDILAALPKGVVAWGQLTSSSQLDGRTSTYSRRGEIQTALEKGRLYRIRLSEHFVEVSGSTNVNVVEELRYSYNGTPIYPDITPNEGTHRGVFSRSPAFAGNATTVNGMEFVLDTGSWTANRGFWLMWLLRPEVSGRPVRVLATSFYSPVLTVEDLGPSVPSTLKRWNDGDGGGSAPEPVDPAPVVVRQTQTWDAASYGGDTRGDLVYQGTYPGVGNRWGGWVFYPAMRGALSGSTIEKFEVYLVNYHWYYGSGGTAVIYPNDGSYKGVVGSGTTSANWPRGAGRWVTLPSSWYASFANGTYRGVSVYTTNTGLTYYGQFKGGPTKFRVTYRK